MGVELLFDLVSVIGKSAVTKVLDPDATDKSLEETRETMKKIFDGN